MSPKTRAQRYRPARGAKLSTDDGNYLAQQASQMFSHPSTWDGAILTVVVDDSMNEDWVDQTVVKIGDDYLLRFSLERIRG